jgi:hypothetical protein
MDRLLTVKLDAIGCEAEALINGVPLARVNAARPRALVPIHEYTLAGMNQLELVVWPHPVAAKPADIPPPIRVKADGHTSASARILLPRLGNNVDEQSSRSIAELVWAPSEGVSFEPPVSLHQDLQLPVSFPRWRWMDAPPSEAVSPALHAQAAAMLQQFGQEFAAGEFTTFFKATQLRSEELAVAYQRPAEASTAQLRQRLEAISATGTPWLPVDPEGLVLRRLAGGRLLECLTPDGEPALRTEPDEHGRVHAFPLRLAAVEGRLYVLR